MGPAALLIAGGGLRAFGAIKEGQIAEAQGKFAKEIAVRNQQALERQAKAEEAASRVKEARVARREKIITAAQRAILGKTGVGLAGATLSVLTNTAFQFSLERNLVLRRGLIRGRELRERGRIEIARGRFAFTMGREAKRLSYIKAGASILAAAGMARTPPPPTQTFGTAPTRFGAQSQFSFGGYTRSFGPSAFTMPG